MAWTDIDDKFAAFKRIMWAIDWRNLARSVRNKDTRAMAYENARRALKDARFWANQVS